MNLLLDTHALIWWLSDDPKLSNVAREAIASPGNAIFVSVVSAFEIATKHRIGKLPEAEPLMDDFADIVRLAQFQIKQLDLEASLFAGRQRIAHKDPFDRLLIGQSKISSMPLVTNERVFETFGVDRIW